VNDGRFREGGVGVVVGKDEDEGVYGFGDRSGVEYFGYG